jgi:fumarate reductase subunit C
LVAITYDSWLYSEFGEHLKKTLLQFGQVDAIYHFKKNAFPDANVGATIIEFTKNSNAIALKKNIDIYQFETAEDLSRYELKPTQKLSKKAFLNFKGNLKSTLDFENDLFCALEKLSAIKPFRGLGTIANQYFIFDTPCYEATIPYIKEVTKIEEMTVSEASKYLLCVNGHKSDALEKYIEQVEVEVKNNTNLLTLKNAISKNATWYKIAPRQTGNLIFNYYLRKNIDFILNINELQVSDNFYILNVKENLFAKFAILNATFSKLAIFEHSRNQGSGLRKIQVFEFLKVPILNLDKLDNTTIVELEILGQALSQAKRLNGEKEIIIEKIDIVLLKTYNKMLNKSLTLSALQADYQKIVANC